VDSGDMTSAPDNFHVMAKPSGAICNLNCTYCFYLEKELLFDRTSRFRMSDEVLEAYVRQQIEGQRGSEASFAWQGGEPTLMGLDFFKKAVALQHRYANGRAIHNAFQTNGVLLDDAWGEFLHRERFLVGLSIDGPQELHDLYRVDKGGKPTFDKVMRGIEVLQRHRVDFNTLSVVHRESARRPLEVYEFLKSIGSTHMQFIPLVDRIGVTDQVAAWSVIAEDYGTFLSTIWDTWVRRDVGRIFVQLFDVMLGVGNLLDQSLGDIVRDVPQRQFGQAKADTLPQYCRDCEVRFACHGECPKNRFINTPAGEPGLNYLCAGYKHFFKHANPRLRGMAWLAMHHEPPAKIMDIIE
jgi:uncharacterized protein